jgi:hypothetical protein
MSEKAAAPSARIVSGKPAAIYLVTVCALALCTQALPAPPWLADVTYTLVSASVAVAILVGIRVHRPKARNAWFAMAAAQGLWVMADATYYWQQDVLHVDAFPTVSDVFYLAGYPVFAVALMILVKGPPRARRDLGPVLDSVMLIAGLGLLTWVLLARPTVEQLHDSGAAAALVAAAYPTMDILLIAALGRLITSPQGRAPAARYLLGALTLLIGADTLSTGMIVLVAKRSNPVERVSAPISSVSAPSR